MALGTRTQRHSNTPRDTVHTKRTRADDTDGDGTHDTKKAKQSGLADQGTGKPQERAHKKKARDERRLSKPLGETIYKIKSIWEKLRNKKDPVAAESRAKLVNECWALCRGSVKDLVLKHDASRVVQTLLKYAPLDLRKQITQELKGSCVELAQSSYGKYLLIKLFHYGDKPTRAQLIDELFGSFRKLMKHKEGAYVIEDVYRDYSTASQKRQIIREFYGSEFAVFKEQSDKDLAAIIKEHPDKRPYLMRNLKATLTSAVSKGSIGFSIIHAAMLEYVKNIRVGDDACLDAGSERSEFVDLVAAQVPEIVHTAEGAQVASRVFCIATAKERKALVKAFRTFAAKLALDEHGHVVLLTMFDSVDDTVFVLKTLKLELVNALPDLLKSKCGRKPFLYLFVGRSPKHLGSSLVDTLCLYDELKRVTSKKTNAARQNELRQAFLEPVLDAIANNTVDLLNDSAAAQFVGEAILSSPPSNACDTVMHSIVELLGHDYTTLMKQPAIPRMLRALVQDGHWNSKTQSVDKVDNATGFKSLLCPIVLRDLDRWVQDEGVFLVISLLENLDTNAKSELLAAVRNRKSAIPSSKGSPKLLSFL